MILAVGFWSDDPDCCHKLLYRPAVAEWLHASRSSSVIRSTTLRVRAVPKFYQQQQCRSPLACSPAPGRQPPLPSHPPLPSAGGTTARWPFPWSRSRPLSNGATASASAAPPPPLPHLRRRHRPRSPTTMRYLHFFFFFLTSSPLQTNAREKTPVAHSTNTSCRTRHLICLFPFVDKVVIVYLH